MGKLIPHWLQAIIAASGGLGLFVLALLDSTVLPFPSVNDILLINLSINAPLRMPYYAAMTTLGSLVGCTILFLVARKGKETLSRKKSRTSARVHRWMERNGFLSLLVGAILPPPTPFKLFVFAAGALEMPLRTFCWRWSLRVACGFSARACWPSTMGGMP